MFFTLERDVVHMLFCFKVTTYTWYPIEQLYELFKKLSLAYYLFLPRPPGEHARELQNILRSTWWFHCAFGIDRTCNNNVHVTFNARIILNLESDVVLSCVHTHTKKHVHARPGQQVIENICNMAVVPVSNMEYNLVRSADGAVWPRSACEIIIWIYGCWEYP